MSDSQRYVVDFDVHGEVKKRMWASFARKLLAGFAVVVALLLLSQMNSAKQAHDTPPAKRYAVTPELSSALEGSAELAQIATVAKAEAEKKPPSGVNSVDDLFQLLYRQAETDTNNAGRDALEQKRDAEIAKLSEQIDRLLYTRADTDAKNATSDAGKQKRNADKSREGHEAQIASLVYSRAMAAAQRASDLAQFDATVASRKTKLHDAFEDVYTKWQAQPSSPGSSHDVSTGINAIQGAFFDEKHPVHTVFDVFWYASLVVAVLGLVYLVLVPLYRLLPFGGVQEAVEKRSEDFFSRRPSSLGSTVRNTIGVVSAVAISLAAMAGPMAHAPGNPFSDTLPPRMFGSAEPQSTQETKSPVGNEGMKTTETDSTAPTVISTAPPITPLPPGKECLTDCSVAADAGFERRIATLENNYELLINQTPPSLDAYASKTYVATAIREHADAESLLRDLGIQQAILADVPRETRAIADAVTAHASDEAVERRKLEARLTHVDTRTVSHSLAADRPSVVERIVGIDRYVVTLAAVSAIEARYPIDDQHPENVAIRKVVTAMQSLGPISRTQIEWQIDGAVSGVAGNATSALRETIRRAKQLVVELSRRPA